MNAVTPCSALSFRHHLLCHREVSVSEPVRMRLDSAAVSLETFHGDDCGCDRGRHRHSHRHGRAFCVVFYGHRFVGTMIVCPQYRSRHLMNSSPTTRTIRPRTHQLPLADDICSRLEEEESQRQYKTPM